MYYCAIHIYPSLHTGGNVRKSQIIPLSLAILLAWLSPTLTSNASAKDLKIGSKAPTIEIEHWVSNGEGKFKPVKKFEKGKVYIVEFWATWCGPCIAAMPHISELQDKYAKKGLQVISVSDEDLETVEEFLERDVRGKDMTYGELTKNYCLTTDPDQSVYGDYMEAAGQNGIPTAFIVGKSGLIEWIGHPMEIDEPIEQVLTDQWDREAYLKKLEEEEKAQRALQQALRKIDRAMQSGDTDEAVEILDELIEGSEGIMQDRFRVMRVQLMLEVGDDRAAAAFAEYADSKKDQPMLLNQMAWTVVEMKQQDEASDELLKAATVAAQNAVESSPNDGAILDTLGHLLYYSGELDQAIEVQTRAVENAGDMKDEIAPLLKKMLKEKAEKSEPKEDDDK